MNEAVGPANVASRLSALAAALGDAPAVIVQRARHGRAEYQRHSFRELDQDSTAVARGLVHWGVPPDARLVLLVPPGYEFIMLVFALLKSGAVQVLIDPGAAGKHLISSLAAANPEGFVAVGRAQAVRAVLSRKFPKARWNVTVGRRWFLRGQTLDALRAVGAGPGSNEIALPSVGSDDPAAVIFTSGSTGPPKGVLYQHGNFLHQVQELANVYGLQPGGVDLACFPLFGLFNAALGVTTVVPDMDASRPASVDPRNLAAALRDCGVTQSFASPAVWQVAARELANQREVFGTLRQVFSAGAPIAPRLLGRLKTLMPQAQIHTPYGATEALPVATIEAREVLEDTAERTRAGSGTCVGRRFPGIEWRVAPIVDGPVANITDAQPLPAGQIGELIVRGPVVTREYVTRAEWNSLAKIADGERVWHRMGDAGYLDEHDRFWFCGRVSQRVETGHATLFTDPCESIFNEHPYVARSALVGVGPRGRQRPVVCIEPPSGAKPNTDRLWPELRALAAVHAVTHEIDTFLLHSQFPVDIRHNAKIRREELARWAERQLR